MEKEIKQSHVFVFHKVENYAKWKKVFDEFIDTRRKGGEKSFQIFCTEDNANDLYLLFTWDNLENAKKFMNSSDLKNAMKNAGVVGTPYVHFLEEVASGIVVKFPQMKH